MKDERCDNCKFQNPKGGYGECRINPPVAAPNDSSAWFPIVELTDWCGKWERKDAA